MDLRAFAPGRGRIFDWLKRPEGSFFGANGATPQGMATAAKRPALWPGGAALNPAHQRSDFTIGQFFIGRHLQLTLVPHSLDDQALTGFPWNNRRPAVAALDRAGQGIQA